jgi:hypothetical protein
MRKYLLAFLLQFSVVLFAIPVKNKIPNDKISNCNVTTNSIYTSIPDPNFEQALIDFGYDIVLDGKVITENVSNVLSLGVSYRGIADLSGIQAFTALQTLHCDNNQLTTLNVSGLNSLTLLNCSGNQITSINVNGCTSLDAFYCHYNQLVSLDISGCTSLTDFGCSYNLLTSIEVSDVTSLYSFACDGNQLTSLDVSGLTSLNTLTCGYNLLKTLNVSGCTALNYLVCNDNQLITLDLSSEWQLTDVDNLICTNNKMDCIKVQYIAHNGDVSDPWQKDAFTAYTTTACHITTIKDPIFEQALIEMGYDTVIDGKVTTEAVSVIKYVDVSNRGITDLTGIQAFTSMIDLACGSNLIKNLDVSGLPSLMYLNCAFNQLTSLNVTGCNAMISITANDNQLANVNVGTLSSLQVVDFQNNLLTSVNAGGNTNLDYINCNNNQLINLNLTGCINLTELHCNNNQFISIDIRDFPALRDFQAQSKSTVAVNEVLYTTMDCASNPNLNCIRVTDEILANSNPNWTKEENAIYTTALCNEEQSFCYGAKVSNLVPSGSNIKWYNTLTGGTALPSSSLLSTRAYYMSQTINGLASERIPVVVTINPKSVAGSIIGASTAICYDSDKTLTLSANHVGTIQWQSSASSNGVFTDIPGATATTFNTGNLTTSTYFRVKVSNNLCSTVYTAPVKVSVQLQSVSGTISGGNVIICPGINSNKLTLSGYLGKIQWQYSKDNIRFHNIPINGTGASYTAKNLKSSTYYRALVTNGTLNCTPAISQSAVINVNAPVNAGVVSGTEELCSGLTNTLSLLGYDEGAGIQWQKATTLSGTYTNATTGFGFTTDSYTTTALTTTAYYRAKVTLNGCSSVSQPFLVTVQKAVAGKITGGTSSTTTVCTGAPSLLTLTGYAGTNIQWLSSNVTTASSFTPIIGANSSTYEATNETAGRTYYKASIGFPNCTPVFTPIIYVSVLDCGLAKLVVNPANNFDPIAFPNPFNHSFTINVDTSSQELIRIGVYDLLGRLIEEKISKPNEIQNQIIGENYLSGIYIVIVNQGTKAKTFRMIKR